MDWIAATAPVAYDDAIAFMTERVATIRAGSADDCVWLLEHPPLYTAGTSAKAGDLREPRFPVHQTGRGGQYTYHGPGQRVAYVMLDLASRGGDIRRYVWQLEEWLIRTLAAFGVAGERRAGRVGIWVVQDAQESKIAAIGVRVTRGVTWHGVSLNVASDLAHYNGIIPCGIAEHGVTSLAALGITASMAQVDARLQETFPEIFG